LGKSKWSFHVRCELFDSALTKVMISLAVSRGPSPSSVEGGALSTVPPMFSLSSSYGVTEWDLRLPQAARKRLQTRRDCQSRTPRSGAWTPLIELLMLKHETDHA
jgi:hypothetical protein